jgi:hypothetical protein
MPAKKTLPKTEEKKSGYRGYKCYATFHPSSVLMGGFQFEEKIIEDFARYNQRQLAPPREGAPLASGTCVGFDTEYDPSGKLLTVGIADATRAAAFETTGADYKKKISASIKKAKVLIGHSVAGDLDHLVRLGLARESWLRAVDIRDSLLLARLHNENGGKGAYGLEALLLSSFNFNAWKAETEKLLKQTGSASDWSPEQRIARCRLDAWATVVLAEHFEGKLNDT